MQVIGDQNGLDFVADAQLGKNILPMPYHRRHRNIQGLCYGLSSTSGTGTYTISQSQLYTAIENDNGYGGLIW